MDTTLTIGVRFDSECVPAQPIHPRAFPAQTGETKMDHGSVGHSKISMIVSPPDRKGRGEGPNDRSRSRSQGAR